MENQLSCNVSIHEELLEDNKKVFVVECVELGISDIGVTMDEALNNLKKAINLYLEETPDKKELLEEPKQLFTTRMYI